MTSAADPAALRVLFLTHAFPRHAGDAAGSFILRLARALRQIGIEVSVLAPHARDLPTRDSIDGIDVIRFRYAPAGLETLAYTGTMAEQVRDSWAARLSLGSMLGASFWRVLRVQQRIAPRLLHAHWWFPAGVVAAATSRISGVPFVTTMHGSDVRLARSTTGAARGLEWVMRASRATTTVSRWLADEAHAMTLTLSPPRVAPLPAATELFTPGGSRAGDRLLFVGRLNVQKGIELLLRAVGAMRSRVQLDVVGDGPDGASVRALASSLGIADRVTWHGALPQGALPDFYRRATALVVPSRDEGLGLVAVEAQLCETPVIAFDSGGLRDIIENEVTGILVDVFSAEALARATDDLLASPGRASSLGAAARRKALAVFSPDAVARNYEAIYRTALGAKSQ